ncbi:MAG: AMP-binding protein [Rhodospirillales bacterium]
MASTTDITTGNAVGGQDDPIVTILDRIRAYGDRPAIVEDDRTVSYAGFSEMIDGWRRRLADEGIGAGTVCGFLGDFSAASCSLYFALLRERAVLVPFSTAAKPELARFLEIASVEFLIHLDDDGPGTIEKLTVDKTNPLIVDFRPRGHAGLVLFSSGSTGGAKGILHDCNPLLRKFLVERPGWRTMLFLLIDHIGGFNTMLSTFSCSGLGVCTAERTPDAVCRLIQDTQAELLPTTPTFLNLLYSSRSWEKFDLSSLQMITYGTEVMSDETLKNVGTMFPNVRIKQTYGLSELGILRSQSESSGSPWVKVGGEGYKTKVVDNILWIKADSNMIGYLNAPSPFDDDGWMCTDDVVEVRGDHFRFKGRQSELINVGGQKVHPHEVEDVLLAAPNIMDAAVFKQSHPILGNVPVARVTLKDEESPADLTKRLRRYCREKLAKHKVPMKFEIVGADDIRNPRFKKIRKADKKAENA